MVVLRLLVLLYAQYIYTLTGGRFGVTGLAKFMPSYAAMVFYTRSKCETILPSTVPGFPLRKHRGAVRAHLPQDGPLHVQQARPHRHHPERGGALRPPAQHPQREDLPRPVDLGSNKG